MGGAMVHATAVFALDVRGKNGKAVDWANYSFISSKRRDPSIGTERMGEVREGIFIIRDGLRSNPVEFKEPSDLYNENWLQIRMIGPDVLDIAADGTEFVRCVRSSEDEVRALRAQIGALK